MLLVSKFLPTAGGWKSRLRFFLIICFGDSVLVDPIKPAVTAHLREMSAFKLYRVVKKKDWHGRAQPMTPMVSILERCPRERES